MKFDVQLTGVKELDTVLHMLGPALAERELGIAARAASKIVQNVIQEMAPVGGEGEARSKASLLYGRLRDNIRVTRRKFTRVSVEYAVHTGNAFWSAFLEFGTSKQSATPFAGPGFDKSAPWALREIEMKLAERLPKVAAQIAGKYSRIPMAVRRRL